MSEKVVLWLLGLPDAPTDDPDELAVLLAMAELADDDGVVNANGRMSNRQLDREVARIASKWRRAMEARS